jgi:hypothetical protein
MVPNRPHHAPPYTFTFIGDPAFSVETQIPQRIVFFP